MVDVAAIDDVNSVNEQLGAPNSLSIIILVLIGCFQETVFTLMKSRGRLISAMNSTKS